MARGGTWWDGVRPYVEREPLAAFALGVSSGFPYAMIGATLTTRLAQDGLDKKTITAFTLGFLVYNLKPLWAWMVDGVRLPLLGRLGQRVSWLLLAGTLAILAVANLALVDPATDLSATIVAAILVGVAGATYDIVIDAYRIETLKPYQLGVGSGMTQYGWRIGSVAAASLALVLAARIGWTGAYLACAVFALPAMLTGLILGEPPRHRAPTERRGVVAARDWRFASQDHGIAYADRAGELDLPPPALPGRHQHANLALAAAMLRHQDRITAPDAAIRTAATVVRWPARMQRLAATGPLAALLPPGYELWLDGGHNEDAAAAIAPAIARIAGDRPLHLVLGLLANKDMAGVLRHLAPLAASLIAVPVPDHAHHDPADLARAARDAGVRHVAAAPDVPTALAALPGPGVVLIAGSLYLAGEVLSLNGEPPD